MRPASAGLALRRSIPLRRGVRCLGIASKKSAMSASIDVNKRLTAARTAEAILALFDARAGDFNAVNFATAMHRLGRRDDQCI
ncbi:hypothetical protein M885DRAFT_525539 [Pelagophyceae sp. CCMP2097]|nr:hypothetical protein M885DRAFT_525539 [Pelagophyceae sp. CCMP2097]